MRLPFRLAVFAGVALGVGCTHEPRLVTLRAEPFESPVPAGARVPELTRLRDGSLLASWMEPRAGGGYTFRMAVRRAERWSEPRTITSHADVLVYSASLPAVSPLGDGALLAYWEVRDRRGDDPYAEKITAALSRDEGRTWSETFVPHRDGVPSAHAFISAFPQGNGLGMVWLDARKTTYEAPPPGKGPKDAAWLGAMALMHTTVDPGGSLGPEVVVDTLTCECCPTATAVTRRGPVVVYRDRSTLTGAGQIRDDQNVVRDIYVARLENDRWTTPRRVFADNWVFNGCPDNGPAVAADGDRVAVAWWTAPEGNGAVKVAFSKDAGDTFAPPVRVDGGLGVGQVTVSLDDEGAVVGWLESGRTQARFVAENGTLGAVTTLGPAAHHARLPRWPRDSAGLIAAWSEGVNDEAPNAVRFARLVRASD